jgi:hypothetical protein
MQDRDSFYRAIRTKISDARRAQHDLSAAPLPEPLKKDQPKGLDLDDPEQRRRFDETKV